MQIKTLIENIFKPYSAILFLDNKNAGIIIALITFINPNVGIGALIAAVFTLLFAHLIGLKDEFLSKGFYVYNSLLVGMGIGYIFTPSIVSIFLIAVSSSFTFLLAFGLNVLFKRYNLPILSLPFSVITILIYLSSLKYSALYSTIFDTHSLFDISINSHISQFLKSFGTIYFLPNNIAGAVLLLIVLYFSRIMFISAIVGFYFGIYLHSLLIGSFEQALHYPYNFNYILVAISLFGVFLLPTLKNFFITLIAIAATVLIGDAIEILFNYFSISIFTIPFNVIVITFIFVLFIISYKEFNYNIKKTPEESLMHYLNTIFRFGKYLPKVSLPFIGEWKVYQAFDDEWTHKGEYRFAYDFVKEVDGKTFKNEGKYPADYYCFGQDVVAPVSGYVVDLRDDLIDNPIGEVDRVNNWGNYIILKSDEGFFVEISHLMQYSLKVKVGEYIKEGAVIAKCGNSGYSPQPHIHIQVQYLGVINSFTREFLFKEYFCNNRLIFNSLPNKGSLINSIKVDGSVKAKLTFVLDDSFKFKVYKKDKFIKEVEFKIKMNKFGEFYFCDEESNKLFFNTNETMFYFYNYEGRKNSYLENLFKLSPKYPFVNLSGVEFIDFLPINLIFNRFKTALMLLIATIKPNKIKVKKSYTLIQNRLKSKNGEVVLSKNYKFFDYIRYNHTTLKRVYEGI